MSTPKTNLHEIELAFTQMNDLYPRVILPVILPPPTSPVAVAASEALETHTCAKNALLERSMANTDAAIASLEAALGEIDTLRAQAEQQREICATVHAKTIRELEQERRTLAMARSAIHALRAQRDSLFDLLAESVPASVIADWRELVDDPCDECEGHGKVIGRDENGALELGRECRACRATGIRTVTP